MVVPSPEASLVHAETEAVPALLILVLRHPGLLRLDLGILLQHAVLTVMFLGMPSTLQQAGVDAAGSWKLYLTVLATAVALMAPMIRLVERGRMHATILAAIAAMGAAQLALMMPGRSPWPLALAMTLFFAAFNFLEAALPALITQLAPGGARGTAMGVYSSAQFLGIFLGGVLGGWCQWRFGVRGGFGFSLAVCCLWLLSMWLGRRSDRKAVTRALHSKYDK